MAGNLSAYSGNKILELLVGKTGFTTPTVYLALCTVVPTAASTGATITEASYTGYLRKATSGSDWGTASGQSITNVAAIQFDPCTAGSSAVIGWAAVDSGTTGAGNILFWGTCVPTTISTSFTPARFAIGALVASAS